MGRKIQRSSKSLSRFFAKRLNAMVHSDYRQAFGRKANTIRIDFTTLSSSAFVFTLVFNGYIFLGCIAIFVVPQPAQAWAI
jgi:hypothetical protein